MIITTPAKIYNLEVSHNEMITISAALKDYADKHETAVNREDWHKMSQQIDSAVK